MSDSKIKSYDFSRTGVETLGADSQETNWPIVYQIYDELNLYVGETTNLKSRMQQHLNTPEKTSLSKFSVVFDKTFNKSAALDLEAQLIQWFGGDGKYTMLNKNDGLADRDYYMRDDYRKQFAYIWEQLRNLEVADKTIKEIENSGLFKFSPYKRLSEDQLNVVNEVLMDLDESFKDNKKTVSVIGGNEGTGKTIVLMYLVKLIRDIQDHDNEAEDEIQDDRDFEIFFKSPFNERFKGKKLAMVVPNQSLKGSIAKVFSGISNLKNSIDLLSPIDFGSSDKMYDVTFVDEAHLLKMSNQEVHKANRAKVDSINTKLFNDNETHTELEWIISKSKNVVMVYGDQRIRPNNISKHDLPTLSIREHLLKSQMRSSGGELYIDYLREILSSSPPSKKETFDNFEFKLYEDFSQFVDAIKSKEKTSGLSRLVAGFAWEWKSNKDKNAYDIVIDGIELKWNSTPHDWVGSKNSVNEVGSIYTIQGYDLNYCGVIIGNDLQYDSVNKKLVLDRAGYFDRGAKKRNKKQLEANVQLADDELLDQVVRTYRILMNRSIKGTYVYVCDNNLREYLSNFID